MCALIIILIIHYNDIIIIEWWGGRGTPMIPNFSDSIKRERGGFRSRGGLTILYGI